MKSLEPEESRVMTSGVSSANDLRATTRILHRQQYRIALEANPTLEKQ